MQYSGWKSIKSTLLYMMPCIHLVHWFLLMFHITIVHIVYRMKIDWLIEILRPKVTKILQICHKKFCESYPSYVRNLNHSPIELSISYLLNFLTIFNWFAYSTIFIQTNFSELNSFIRKRYKTNLKNFANIFTIKFWINISRVWYKVLQMKLF